MASFVKSVGKSKSKRERPRGNQPTEPPRQLSSRAETARGKLLKLQEYQTTRPSELKKLAADLTDKERLKATWFETPDGHLDGGQEIQQQAATRSVPVRLFLALPQKEDRERTFTGSVASDDSIEAQFEQFCSYGINSEAALMVGGQYLKWVPSSLVIPRGEKIRDENDGAGAGPLSIGDEPPTDLGDSDKLDDLLELVADYNGSRSYNAVTKNAKFFIREALHKLGKAVPPLLEMFENYQQRIMNAHQLGIRGEFNSHKDLDNYFEQNHAAVVKNKRNVEYLFFLCVCFHVKAHNAVVGVVGGRQKTCSELDCCLPFLLTNLTEDSLIFNEYWQRFRTSGFN